MVYCFVHLDDDAPDPAGHEEEVFVVVPDTSKVVMAVPLDALPEFLVLLQQAVGDLPLPECRSCMATMPCLAVCSSPHNEPPQTG